MRNGEYKWRARVKHTRIVKYIDVGTYELWSEAKAAEDEFRRKQGLGEFEQKKISRIGLSTDKMRAEGLEVDDRGRYIG
jgi:hypothetical protein